MQSQDAIIFVRSACVAKWRLHYVNGESGSRLIGSAFFFFFGVWSNFNKLKTPDWHRCARWTNLWLR